MKNLQGLLFAFVLIILFFLLGYCAGKRDNGGETLTTRVDTFTTHHTDTVYITHNETKYIYRPVPTVTLPNNGVSADDSIRVYHNQAGDSLVNILVDDTVVGKLLSSKIHFDYRIPTITNTDSIFINRTEVKYPMRFYLETFVSTKPPQLPGFGFGMNLSMRKYSGTYRYDLLRKEHTLGFGIKIF